MGAWGGIFKAVTHGFAVVLSGAVVFAVSPAGQALVHQYPKLAGALGIVTALGSLYHNPVKE